MIKEITKKCDVENCNNIARSNSGPYCMMHFVRKQRGCSLEDFILPSSKMQYTSIDTAFDEFNDSNMWLLGLLWTDGYMKENRNSVCLVSKDYEMIEFAKSMLSNDYKVRNCYVKGELYKRFEITSKKLHDRLVDLGMYHNKSLTIKYPVGTNDTFFGSFLRGVIDGDGGYAYHDRKDNRRKTFIAQITSASKDFVDELVSRLKSININSYVYTRGEFNKNNTINKSYKGNNIYIINIAEIQSNYNLYNLLYPTKDVPCLKRKFDIFSQFISDRVVNNGKVVLYNR